MKAGKNWTVTRLFPFLGKKKKKKETSVNVLEWPNAVKAQPNGKESETPVGLSLSTGQCAERQ